MLFLFRNVFTRIDVYIRIKMSEVTDTNVNNSYFYVGKFKNFFPLFSCYMFLYCSVKIMNKLLVKQKYELTHYS